MHGINDSFTYESPEWIMRKLADYAFMLKDYKHALSTYETVKRDYVGSERFNKYQAGAQVHGASHILGNDWNYRSFGGFKQRSL